jgi:hypothetical protein
MEKNNLYRRNGSNRQSQKSCILEFSLNPYPAKVENMVSS